MSTLATTTSHSATQRSSLAARAAAGGGLLCAASGLGATVTRVGAQHTGELELDTALSHERVGPLVALAHGIDVGLGPLVGPLLVAFVAAVVFVRHRRAAVVFAGTTAALWVGAAATKVVFARPRPPAAEVHALVHETAADSFPSGHTAFAMAVVCGAFFARRSAGRSGRLVLLLGVPAAVVVAASRLYLGAHFLGDVVGSFLFVIGLAVLGSALAGWWCGRRASA